MKEQLVEHNFKKFVFAGICICILWANSSVEAKTIYVSKNGSDGNSCSSAENESSSKKTINAGLGCLSGGDTLIVKTGNYPERIKNSVPSGSSWSNATTIKSATGETVILDPGGSGNDIIYLDSGQSYIVFDGLTLDGSNLPNTETNGGMEIKNRSNVRSVAFQNGEVRNMPSSGITVGMTCTDIRIVNNKIHDIDGSQSGNTPGAHGLYFRASDSLVEDNEIYNFNGYGVHIRCGSSCNDANSYVENNVFRRNIVHDGDPGLSGLWDTTGHSRNNIFYNNILYNGRNGMKLDGSDKIYNNTIYNTSSQGIEDRANSTIINNIVYMTGGLEGGTTSNNLTSDPDFMDASAHDFRLKTTSPAKNAGLILNEVEDDFLGIQRPQGGSYDIGSFEFDESSGGGNPPSPPQGLQFVVN